MRGILADKSKRLFFDSVWHGWLADCHADGGVFFGFYDDNFVNRDFVQFCEGNEVV